MSLRLRASVFAHGLIALLVSSLAAPRAIASPLEPVTRVTLAAGGPRVTVVVVGLDARAAAGQGVLEGAAEDALERAGRFTVVPAREAFNPNAGRKRAEAIDTAREKVKQGKQALDDLDTVKATESFSAALEALGDGADFSRDFAVLTDARTMRAAGHATAGENAPAKKDMEAVIALSPRAEFSPTFFTPDLIKFAETQRKQAANARGALLVRTEPAGARVWVDGVFRGVSPVTVDGLTSVKHHVTASLGGYALAQTLSTPGEELISFAAAELGPAWKKAVGDVKKDPEGETRDLAAQQLARAASVDQLVLVLARKSLAGEKLDLIALRLEAKDQHNAAYRTGTVGLDDAEALSTFFDGLTGRDDKRDGRDPVHHFKGGGGMPVKTVVGLGLAGVGAAGILTGVVFGVLAANNAAAFKDTPQTARIESQRLRTEGQTFAAVADVSYLVGLAAGATGGVLLVTQALAPTEDAAPAAGPRKAEDTRRRDADKRAAEERRAADERARQDQAQRDEEKRREDDKRKADARAAEDKKRAEEEAAARKAEDDKKLSKKERDALEKKRKEDEARAKKEEEARRKEEERQRKEEEARAKKEEEARRKEDEKRAADEKRRQDEERAQAAKKKGDETAAARKADEDQARREAEEKARRDEEARREEEARKKREEEERKRREADEKRKKDEDHDDLRNY